MIIKWDLKQFVIETFISNDIAYNFSALPDWYWLIVILLMLLQRLKSLQWRI